MAVRASTRIKRGRKLSLSKSETKDPAKKATDVVSAIEEAASQLQPVPEPVPEPVPAPAPSNRPRAVLATPPKVSEPEPQPEEAVPVAEEIPEAVPAEALEEIEEDTPSKPYVSRRKTPEQMAEEEASLRSEAHALASAIVACESEIRLAGEDVTRMKQDLRSLKEELTGRVEEATSVVVGVHTKTDVMKLVYRNKDGENLHEADMPPSFKRKYAMLKMAEKDLKEQEESVTVARDEQKLMLQKAEQLKLRREMLEKDVALRNKSSELKDRIHEVAGDMDDAAAEAKEALDEFTRLGIELGKKHPDAKKIDVGRDQELLLKGDNGKVVESIKMPAKMARRWEQYQRANKDSSEGKKDTEAIRLERKNVVDERLAMRRKVRAAAPSPANPRS